jgi:antitoxin Phd
VARPRLRHVVLFENCCHFPSDRQTKQMGPQARFRPEGMNFQRRRADRFDSFSDNTLKAYRAEAEFEWNDTKHDKNLSQRGIGFYSRGGPRSDGGRRGHQSMKTKELQLKDAKATLSAVVDNAGRGQAYVITRYGRPEAVLIGYRQWKRLSRVPSFGRLLMAAPVTKGDLPRRNRGPLREAKP